METPPAALAWEARKALIQARDAMDHRPDLVWMVEHPEELVAVIKLQTEREEPPGD
jgi:hypothetical protein